MADYISFVNWLATGEGQVIIIVKKKKKKKNGCAFDISLLMAIYKSNCLGKSNLMDAISFVLGIKARDLRGVKLKDLIYEVLTSRLSIYLIVANEDRCACDPGEIMVPCATLSCVHIFTPLFPIPNMQRRSLGQRQPLYVSYSTMEILK